MSQNRQTFYLCPVGYDLQDSRVMAHKEAEVHIIQPAGCPKNGTMGCVYVQTARSGQFIGLVSRASLIKSAGEALPVRDLAAEARNARSDRFRRPSPFQVV
jgi:hypothetical protein